MDSSRTDYRFLLMVLNTMILRINTEKENVFYTEV